MATWPELVMKSVNFRLHSLVQEFGQQLADSPTNNLNKGFFMARPLFWRAIIFSC